MSAPERQVAATLSSGDALEIAVRDLPAPAVAAEQGTLALLPFSREPVDLFDEWILEGDDSEPDAGLDEDDVLLEASDVIEVEAVRAAIGLDVPVDEPVDEPVPEPNDEANDEPAIAKQLPATEAAVDFVEDQHHTVDPIRVPLWSGANSLAYALSRGLRGMGQSPLVQLLAIGTMAVCMLLLGTTTLILQNAQRVAGDLGVDTPVTVYMDPGTDAESLAQLQARVAELPEVATIEHVTPQMALTRLQEGLGEDERAELLAGVDSAYLPDSLEIALVAGVEPGFADALAGRIAAIDSVDEVAVLGPWVQQLEQMLDTLRWLAFGVAGLVSVACLAIVGSTIRLGVFARRSEIDILRLVGGTGRFVRGPFVVEGVLQGVLGTGLALACLWLSFELIEPFLARGMALMFAAGSLRFFTVVEIAVALGFGAMLGVIGSRAAVARHA